MNDLKTKQQIVEKIKSSSNILVTVSNDPSVDALSAAIGLTVMLNKMGKHATAVFSGAIPPAITFLEPDKTFEATTDSLRDFIIALDKEKADHLRYKVDGEVVKIFITPYRTTITSDDLEFSQGDYNVELVLALGVDNQDHLDDALEAHGRILHDATVATISAGEQTSQLGGIDWHDDQSSSLSEMLVSLGEALKSDKPLLDQQIATALLTGIVAETDRFSNTRTSSKAMTVAAQLMAAGADQQLIAARLQESHEIGGLTSVPSDDGTVLSEDVSTKIDKTVDSPAETHDGELAIKHEPIKTLDDIANEVKVQNQEDATDVAEQVLAEQLEEVLPAPAQVVVPTELEAPAGPMVGAVDWAPPASTEPSLGGTLNATTEQAEEDTRRQQEDDQNKTILTHSYLSESPTYDAPINGATQPNEAADVDIFGGSPNLTPVSGVVPEQSPVEEKIILPLDSGSPVPEGQTLADLDAQNRENAPGDDALAAVHATFDDQQPSVLEPGIVLPQPPPLPDFSTLPPPSIGSAYAPDSPSTAPELLGDIFAPESPPPSSEQPPSVDDPGQFKIPGQQ